MPKKKPVRHTRQASQEEEKYRVHIGHINQSHYDVEAEDMTEASERAKRLWREGSFPDVIFVEKRVREENR